MRRLALTFVLFMGGMLPLAEGSSPSARVEIPIQLRPFKTTSLRWKDIADRPYGAAFQRSYHYGYELDGLKLAWNPESPLPAGQLTVRRLKPNFAYQLKLMGRKGVRGSWVGMNSSDPEVWASFQLGHHGRWWCEDCDWNTSDSDLDYHVRRGHQVLGYVIFDWFVTDAQGQADLHFTVESSYHVLWHTGQRQPGRQDSSLRRYVLKHGAYGYGDRHFPEEPVITLFGEWESGRALPGQLQLPAGDYEVHLNLTEESFHAAANEGGGRWAQVMEAPVSFRVAPAEQTPSAWSTLRYWLVSKWPNIVRPRS